MEVAPIPFKPQITLKPQVLPFFDPATNTVSYIVRDPSSTACAVIDSVMHFDYASGSHQLRACGCYHRLYSRAWMERRMAVRDPCARQSPLGGALIQQHLGGKLGIGEYIIDVQETFGKVFNEGTEFQRHGSQFDRLFADGDSYMLGTMRGHVLHTPGHTPACTTHVIGDAAFVGDTLFMPDGDSARADFPGGDAATLFRSIKCLLTLPSEMRLFICHDYGPNGRDIRWETTVGQERLHNVHVHDGVTEAEFVAMRQARDATLGMPKLITPSLQVNMRAGRLPPKDETGKTFLKVPVNVL
jgi:glyoxylase-like metal-dependent hydrolase (beta-lactamase superfamily II)